MRSWSLRAWVTSAPTPWKPAKVPSSVVDRLAAQRPPMELVADQNRHDHVAERLLVDQQACQVRKALGRLGQFRAQVANPHADQLLAGRPAASAMRSET